MSTAKSVVVGHAEPLTADIATLHGGGSARFGRNPPFSRRHSTPYRFSCRKRHAQPPPRERESLTSAVFVAPAAPSDSCARLIGWLVEAWQVLE
jgi:hypothetical protein